MGMELDKVGQLRKYLSGISPDFRGQGLAASCQGRNAFLTNFFCLFVSWLLPKTQLLELRTNNYQLSDELRKNGVGEPRESH